MISLISIISASFSIRIRIRIGIGISISVSEELREAALPCRANQVFQGCGFHLSTNHFEIL